MADLFNILADKYPLRAPTQSETNFFKANKIIGGYAADDKSVVLNPFSTLKESERKSVADNERIRLALKESGINPKFDISDEQVSFFKSTPYENDPIALRSTIVSRILSGDPSAKATPDQLKEANSIKERILSIFAPQVSLNNMQLDSNDALDSFVNQRSLLSARSSDRFRPDNTLKQSGFFGPLQRPDGSSSTELSIGVNFDGNETLIPLLVPTLNKGEVDHLLSGKKETKSMVDKAVLHARQRLKAGLSPFATNEEIPYGIKQ